MKPGEQRNAGIFSALILGAALSQSAHAGLVRHDQPMEEHATGFKFDDASHAAPFGKQISEDAKLPEWDDAGDHNDDEKPKRDWSEDPVDWDKDADKWDNSQSHPDDDKWDDHKNDVPGPIGNPCKSEFCDVTPAAVPVPAALWLLGSGLIGLFGLARRS